MVSVLFFFWFSVFGNLMLHKGVDFSSPRAALLSEFVVRSSQLPKQKKMFKLSVQQLKTSVMNMLMQNGNQSIKAISVSKHALVERSLVVLRV